LVDIQTNNEDLESHLERKEKLAREAELRRVIQETIKQLKGTAPATNGQRVANVEANLLSAQNDITNLQTDALILNRQVLKIKQNLGYAETDLEEAKRSIEGIKEKAKEAQTEACRLEDEKEADLSQYTITKQQNKLANIQLVFMIIAIIAIIISVINIILRL